MLRCSVCGSTYDEAALPWRCACGAPLDWVIGGAPISPAFAKKVGADAYSVNANAAVRIAREMLSC